ncbi:MAG: PH domain-containing protein, partial [Chloroflexota bacterium]
FLSQKRMNTVLAYYPEVRQRLNPIARPQQPVTQPENTSAPAAPPVKQAPAAPANIRKSQATRKTGYEFQRENEEIILVRRRHPWAFIRRGWMCILVILFSAGLGVVMTLADFPAAIAGIAVAGGFVLAGLLMTYFYFEWRNDSFVVTDTRVIRIERVIPTFNYTVNEIPLNRIQEINTELPEGDLFARIFDYGDVELRNAADAGDMVLDMIPRPDEVQEAIFTNQTRRRELADRNKRNALRAEIEQQIGISSGATGKMMAASAGGQKAIRLEHRGWAPARMQFLDNDGNTVIRKHATVWLQAIILPAVLIVFGVILLVVGLFTSGPGFIGPIALLGGLASLTVGGLWFWWSDWDWRNDMYIIADEMVTLIHRRPLWLQNENEQVILSRVDSVVSETSGFWDTVFQRGDVKLSLIGEGMENAKRFIKVYKPHEIQAEISRRQARAKEKAEQANDDRQREAIKEYLSVYHETVQDLNGPAAEAASEGTYMPDTSFRPHESQDRRRPPNIPRRQ